MDAAFRFLLGLSVGSFLNVVSLRYKPDKFLLSWNILGGRSRCPHCRNELTWRELVPLLSFILQAGRCRNCKQRISLQYPLVELASGMIFLLVPTLLPSIYLLQAAWIFVFLILLLASLIDIRLRIIPDEAQIFIALVGFFIVLLSEPRFSLSEGSFLGGYAMIFGLRGNIWLNHIAGALFGGLLFLVLFLITRGRGMGMGDVKLAAALGFAFGWPDIVLISALSFIIGSVFGLAGIILGKQRMKSMVPFGPFFAAACVIVFFFGFQIADFYFGLLKLF